MPNSPTESIIFKETNAPLRLLVSFAHPDDESFGIAGTIIHYARNGVDVHYACGTRGEAGTVDPHFLDGYNSIGELRTQELLNASEKLGLSGLHFLNYRDSGMENSPDNDNPDCLVQAPVEEVAEKVTALIRQIQPQVVITFDPTGGYFHPDHIHMHKATTLAFNAAGDPTQYPHQLEAGLKVWQAQKLYYTAFPRGFVKVVVKLLPLFGKDPAAFGRNNDINLKRIAEARQTVTTKLKVAPYYEAGRQAAACHASQLAGGTQRLPRFIQKWMGRYDSYTRIAPPVVNGAKVERDLFDGVE